MKRKRESHLIILSTLIVLFVVAPAFAFTPVPYTSFSNKYNFNPWGTIGGTGEEVDVWTQVKHASAPAWTNTIPGPTGTGILSQSNTGANYYARWDLTGSDPVGAVTAWTMEIRARVTAQGAETGSGNNPPAGLYFGLMNNAKKSTELVMQTNAIILRTSTGWVTLDTSANTDFTTIRVVRYSTGSVFVFRNGSTATLGSKQTTATSTVPITSYVIFGDNAYATAATDGLTCDIDYLAFDIGNAYVPEPATMIILALGSLGLILRKRR